MVSALKCSLAVAVMISLACSGALVAKVLGCGKFVFNGVLKESQLTEN